jgi:hypothetical protein
MHWSSCRAWSIASTTIPVGVSSTHPPEFTLSRLHFLSSGENYLSAVHPKSKPMNMLSFALSGGGFCFMGVVSALIMPCFEELLWGWFV